MLSGARVLGVMYSGRTMTLSVCAIGFRSAKNHSQHSTGRLRARGHPGPHHARTRLRRPVSAVEPDAEDARAVEILDDEAALFVPLTRLGRPARSSGGLWGATQSTRGSRVGRPMGSVWGPPTQ